MSQTYFAILTAVGEAKLSNAAALGVPLQLALMAVGDGNGNLPVPNRLQTALVREVYEAPLNELKIDPANASQIIAELVIPETEGGYWLREMGLKDAAGDLIAVANCPPSYKPEMAEGSGRTQVLRMVLIVSSTAAVQLKIDPSVVLATRAYADSLIAVHMAAADPHPQYVNNAELAAAIAAINTVPTGYFSGLVLSNNAATPTTDIDIAPGLARSASDTATLRLAAAITKRLQNAGAWAAGSGGNGLFNGARANNTWYHVFLIRKDSDGSIDVGFDTSISAANKPAGWSAFRRVGSIKTNAAGAIIPFLQHGRRFSWRTPILDVSVLVPAAGSATYVLSVPPGISVEVKATLYISGGDAAGYLNHPDFPSIAVHYLPGSYVGGNSGTTNASAEYFASEVNVPTNEASQVKYTGLTTQSNDVRIATLGWLEI
ncbi:phage tail protein [Pseudomonas sp. zfem001]|uniref:phage tail protein n=1 Tax=Pseudomonas sp. zfem001 TaxID=3078196 RepID=UPI002927BC11|nr:phage tail protein [Pseudomonas sp. zfem001]MDU9408230.1 phage tail protein [Pseudomonas sp. zfem001]